jgi:hypothetical protein
VGSPSSLSKQRTLDDKGAANTYVSRHYDEARGEECTFNKLVHKIGPGEAACGVHSSSGRGEMD